MVCGGGGGGGGGVTAISKCMHKDNVRTEFMQALTSQKNVIYPKKSCVVSSPGKKYILSACDHPPPPQAKNLPCCSLHEGTGRSDAPGVF